MNKKVILNEIIVYHIFNMTHRLWQSSKNPNDFIFISRKCPAKDWHTQIEAENEVNRLKEKYPTYKFSIEKFIIR